MTTLLLLLLGANPDQFNLSLTADGILVAIGISALETSRSRRSRLIHGFVRPGRHAAPDVHPYVLSARASDGNPLNNHRIDITFSQDLAATPIAVDPAGVTAQRDPAVPARLAVDVPASLLESRQDVLLPLRFAAADTGLTVTHIDIEPQSSQLQPRDLVLLRPRAVRRVAVAAVLAVLLVIVGVLVSRFVPVPLAPLAGRILIVLALVPVGIGFVHSRVLDRF